VKAGKGKTEKASYAHNSHKEETHKATSVIENSVVTLDLSEFKDICYFIPCPKSPHG